MKKFFSTTITLCNSGFGMYQANEYNGDGYDDEHDLLDEIKNNVDELFILGTDIEEITKYNETADENEKIEDIRGNIVCEPSIVYAWVKYSEYGNEIGYGGITQE